MLLSQKEGRQQAARSPNPWLVRLFFDPRTPLPCLLLGRQQRRVPKDRICSDVPTPAKWVVWVGAAQLMSIFASFGFSAPLFIFALTAHTDF